MMTNILNALTIVSLLNISDIPNKIFISVTMFLINLGHLINLLFLFYFFSNDFPMIIMIISFK